MTYRHTYRHTLSYKQTMANRTFRNKQIQGKECAFWLYLKKDNEAVDAPLYWTFWIPVYILRKR